MPNFNFAIINKKESENKKVKTNYETLRKDVEGVIFIDINGEYTVAVEKDKYKLTKESYSSKGKTIVYAQGFDSKRRLRHIRNSGEKYETNPLFWLPFHAGVLVRGNIVKHLGNTVFNIKKILHDTKNELCDKAFSFYKENYKEINKNIITKRNAT